MVAPKRQFKRPYGMHHHDAPLSFSYGNSGNWSNWGDSALVAALLRRDPGVLMFSAVCCLWFPRSSSAFQVLVLLFRLSIFVFLFLSSAYSFPPCFKGFAVLRASESPR